ncbi:MAG: hypothetical protein JWM34_3282 [Ilumatobacteraceae bacterium]|nr:hypothetical protein [Ilumatobacteraceae bacterium]
MTKPRRTDLRERYRDGARSEIAERAIALFLVRGFEATTIDDIAATVGVSQRSVFRHFSAKEEIILGRFDPVSAEMLATLRARPVDEDMWASLHQVVSVLLMAADTQHDSEYVKALHKLVFETPALLAGYLQRLQTVQNVIVGELLRRAELAGRCYEADDPRPRAVTAAAFGCLVAAQHSWLASGSQCSFAEAVDRAMVTVAPCV